MVQLLCSDPKVQAWIPDVQNAWQRHLSPVERSDALACNRVGGCSGFLIRKSLFEAVGGFDEDFPSMQDWDLWLRLIERNALYYSGVTGVIYDPNSEQKITHNLLAKYRGLRRLYFKHLNLWTPSAREQHLLRLWALRRLLAGQIGAFGNWLASGYKLQALYYTHRWRRFAPSQTSSAKQIL
jgi:GT2 family glycosyltransferase